MNAVYKYKLSPDNCSVLLPSDAVVLSAGVQKDEIFIWAMVDTMAKILDTRNFLVVGTGHPIEKKNLRFIQTVFYPGGLVFHVFEVLSNETEIRRLQ